MKSDKSSPKKNAVDQAAPAGGEPAIPPRPRRTRKPSVAGTGSAVPLAAEASPRDAAAPKPKRKAPAKKKALVVPSILLEGDKPPPPPAAGPGQRYALGPVAPGEHAGPAEEPGELPEAYGTRQLFLAARDPHWLYARWDFTREQQKHYNALSTDRHLALRIFVDEFKGEPVATVHVHPESTHWFVHVNAAGTKYLAEIGYFLPGGKWITISQSTATLTPPDTMSEDTSAVFATIPVEVPFAQMLEMAREAVRENIPFTEIVQQLRAHGHQAPKSPAKWTPAQERALAAIISMDKVRRVWMGSLEITELIRRQMIGQISSMAAAELSRPTSPIGAISSISSLSSPFGGRARQKGFWFNVNAELIIYGATEPDAQVTIGGRVIRLRPDGSFSYRFALPDGQYELPAVAVSSDKSDARAAELSFSRGTEYRGEVGAHPQDPQLKPPLAAHVA